MIPKPFHFKEGPLNNTRVLDATLEKEDIVPCSPSFSLVYSNQKNLTVAILTLYLIDILFSLYSLYIFYKNF